MEVGGGDASGEAGEVSEEEKKRLRQVRFQTGDGVGGDAHAVCRSSLRRSLPIPKVKVAQKEE